MAFAPAEDAGVYAAMMSESCAVAQSSVEIGGGLAVAVCIAAGEAGVSAETGAPGPLASNTRIAKSARCLIPTRIPLPDS